MKHLKSFETNDTELPQIGDYVICGEEFVAESETDIKLKNFTSNNIGIVYNFIAKQNVDYPYLIKYENIPEILLPKKLNLFDDNCRKMSVIEIKYWSKSKEELKLIIQANKYNL